MITQQPSALSLLTESAYLSTQLFFRSASGPPSLPVLKPAPIASKLIGDWLAGCNKGCWSSTSANRPGAASAPPQMSSCQRQCGIADHTAREGRRTPTSRWLCDSCQVM